MVMQATAVSAVDNSGTTMDLLWRLNRGYSQRLGRARSRLELLARLLADRQADAATQEAVEIVIRECEQLYEEYRRWRFTYYYRSPQDRRMVEDAHGQGRALAQFARMRQRHAQRAGQIAAHLNYYRPPAGWTAIPQGDLWSLTTEAFTDLQTLEYVE